MQQHVPRQIARRAHRIGGHELGAHHRQHRLAHQADGLEPGIGPGAVADGQIDIPGPEIHQVHAGVQPHVHQGMGGLEAAQARHQPFGGEAGRRGEGEAPAVHRGGEQGGGLGQAVEGLAQGGEGRLGGVGEEQAPGRALEERGADIVFEVLDLLGDGAGRH